MNIFSTFIKPDKFHNGLKDLSHLNFSLFYDVRPTEKQLSLSPLNVLIVSEPNEYFGNHDWAVANKDYFSLILSWSDLVLKRCENSSFLVYGESWFDDKHIFEQGTTNAKKREKEFSVSFLRGNKLQSIGHAIRHEIFSRQEEIKVPKQFWTHLGDLNDFSTMKDTKEESFGKYQFSICIENNSREGYFTEKITDCILCKTIPIYYGCSNIGQFYNPESIIQFQNADQAIKFINNLTPEYYTSRLSVIEENYQRAFEYRDYIQTINKTLTNIFKENNII
jgi:hypothetical protein